MGSSRRADLTVELVEVGATTGRAAAVGPPVVIGHALTLDRRSVDGLATALVLAGHRTFVWELPDHGAAPAPAVAWSVGALGAALADAIADAAIGPPVLAGVSMGGFAALEAAGVAGADVAALALIGCSGSPAPPIDPDRVASIASWAAGGRLDGATATAMAVAELGRDHLGADALCRDWRDDASAGRRFLTGYLALFTRPDPAPAAAAVRERHIPCCVIRGEHDPWVSAADSQRLAEGLGSEHVEIAGAAHQPQWTHAAAVVDAVCSLAATAPSGQ